MNTQVFRGKTIHRKIHRENFTVLPNALIQDKRLSFRARGILILMLSMPDNWQTYQSWIEEQGVEGEDAIRSAVRELEALGYLSREKLREKGRIKAMVWKWSDTPEPGKSSSGEPGSTKYTDVPKSKESKETSLDGVSISPEWKPDSRTKKQKLDALHVPRDYPSEREFDAYIANCEHDMIAVYRMDLYRELCLNKWHTWKKGANKWVLIRDWKAYLDALNVAMLRSKEG